MDKFVIKTPRQPKQKSQPNTAKKELKQATIESLQRVVVVEDIMRLKVTLELENQNKEILLQALQELDRKIPSREVLLSTKIGHTLNHIRKHTDPEVAKKAKTIRNKWKQFIKEKSDKPVIEVRADAKTEKQRSSARKLLAGAVGLPENSKLVENIEREVFHQNSRLLNNSYRKTMRTMIFAAKNNEEVRTQVKDGSLSVPQFIAKYRR